MSQFLNSEVVSVRKLLTAQKYFFEYYQRNYDWSKSNIEDLLSDFINEFESSRASQFERPDYYLGPMIISRSDDPSTLSVVDGQQRLTSLTLILLYLKCKLQKEIKDSGQGFRSAEDLIAVIGNSLYSIEKRGATWALGHDREVISVLEGIEADTDQDLLAEKAGNHRSAMNVIDRFANVDELLTPYFGESDETIELMCDFAWWMLEAVKINKITAISTEQAYKIFETQNDRGLDLAPFDMLKAFLLSRIGDSNDRSKAARAWATSLSELTSVVSKSNERKIINDFFRDYFRAKYADSASFSNGIYDRFASEYHRWVEKNIDSAMSLESSDDILLFVTKTLPFYIKNYTNVIKLQETFDPNNSSVFFNHSQSYALQPMIILSGINEADSEAETLKKIKAIALFIEIYTTREFWSGRSWKPNYTKFKMVDAMVAIRDGQLSSLELETLLYKLLDRFASIVKWKGFATPPTLSDGDKKFIRTLMARMTDEVECQALYGKNALSGYSELGKFLKYDIEHIMANKFEQQWKETFESSEEFATARNRMGALILLDGKTNKSLQDKPYELKLRDYATHGPYIAKVLSETIYDTDQRDFISQSGWHKLKEFANNNQLRFKPHSIFNYSAIEDRDSLYRDLASIVWNPARILTQGQEVPVDDYHREWDSDESISERRNVLTATKIPDKVATSAPLPTLKDLLDNGFIRPGRLISAMTNYPGESLLIEDGTIEVGGKYYSSPSTAAVEHARLSNPQFTSANGWINWKVEDEDGRSYLLDELRSHLQRQILAGLR